MKLQLVVVSKKLDIFALLFFSYAWALKRDYDRLEEVSKRVDVNPLGRLVSTWLCKEAWGGGNWQESGLEGGNCVGGRSDTYFIVLLSEYKLKGIGLNSSWCHKSSSTGKYILWACHKTHPSEWWELLSRITWLIDNWPISWLTDSLSVAKRLMDWLTEYYWLCNWLANDHLFSWLTHSLPVWLTVSLTVWETVWVTHWLVDWPTDYLYDCLTDWLNKCLSGCFIAFLVVPLQGILSILTVSFFPKVNIFR